MSAPRWASAVLRWLAPPDWVDDLLGDLEEGHRRRSERHGRTVAAMLTSLDALDMMAVVVHEHVGRWISDTWIAVRTLRRSPGFVLVTVLTLAVGIGANTATAANVNPRLFRNSRVACRRSFRRVSTMMRVTAAGAWGQPLGRTATTSSTDDSDHSHARGSS